MTSSTHRTGMPVILILVAFVASGCFTVQYTIPPEHERTSYDVIGSFEVKQRASWLILGLVPMREADVEDIVTDEVERQGGDAATNVVVTAQYDGVDVIVGLLVGGIFNTRSYTVTGDVVQFRGAMGSLPDEDLLEPRARSIIGEIQYTSAPAP